MSAEINNGVGGKAMENSVYTDLDELEKML